MAGHWVTIEGRHVYIEDGKSTQHAKLSGKPNNADAPPHPSNAKKLQLQPHLKNDVGEKIRKGSIVQIKPEWQDKGDEKFTWIALSDEEKGRLDIQPLGTKLSFPPIYTVRRDMLK